MQEYLLYCEVETIFSSNINQLQSRDGVSSNLKEEIFVFKIGSILVQDFCPDRFELALGLGDVKWRLIDMLVWLALLVGACVAHLLPTLVTSRPNGGSTDTDMVFVCIVWFVPLDVVVFPSALQAAMPGV